MAKFYYGGQAVMEGVMMRGRKSAAVAVRKPDGEISLYEEALNASLYQNKLLRLPFLRGMLMLWEMLVLGTRMMTMSANIASGALDPSSTGSPQSLSTLASTSEAEEKPAQLGGWSLAISLVVSLGFAVAIFFVSPLLITSLLHKQIGDGWLNLITEGVIRLLLLVGYLYLIGRVPDIQRVFGYHGAEHKAINTLEQGDTLDVAHVRRASRVHTRCGTGFLLLVMVVSIFVFALLGSPTLWLKIVSRIVLVPVVAGIAYELMRLGAANYRYRVVRWLLAPGLALQGLTTREPDDSMIECAIASLKRVIARDEPESLAVADVANLPPLAAVE
ncbi:DUF1385 domain-containing protein [Tengunoibacter tsumagoiensis]|uniref:Membrane protein n=1 Tax=Tengunoibacter tsumagoiensis TaxID=2014871 RepID=A0A402A3U9_9CHLR|nr:DUF1385 domain-containing protein [Tengunoibacter tsumagoiensis]GCE13827.1 membrane protein [Tengunoibacter tsumagoiensis]